MSISNCVTFAAIGDISSDRIWAIVLGTLLALVAISLLVASWTKWGQTKSLTKCIALAFLAHVWLLMYAYGTRIVTPGFGGGSGGGMRTEMVHLPISLLAEEEPVKNAESDSKAEASSEEDKLVNEPLAPWEAPLARTQDSPVPAASMTAKETPKIPDLLPATPKVESTVVSASLPPELPPLETADEISQLAMIANPIPTPPQSPAPGPAVPTTAVAQALPSPGAPLTNRLVTPQSQVPMLRMDQQPVPSNYQMRLSSQRSMFAMQNGGDANSEASVERALAWLARNQGPDGGWNAAEHGAGRGKAGASKLADNENRDKAGLKANTAMTGLALLAFLGAGHTHTEGRYKENVAGGIQYLLSQQFQRSGDLSGRDQVGHDPTVRFSRMYSHGMAGLALAEAYGMTGDPALKTAIASACQYTQDAMNPRTGGWRYEYSRDDPGDLSQFGWQAMLLNSASNHRSYALSSESRFLMQRFLDSVSTGRHGGLAVYRPIPGQLARPEQATPAMTAEALTSRLLLGFPLSPAAANEGQRLLLSNLPGKSEENLYYWYYATLAMYQLRGDASVAKPANDFSEAAWNQWNEAIKNQLCATQVPNGPSEGSWHPTCVWGAYGGRVYSTAMACMCLEVYYRYLPMYKQEQFANQWQPARR